MHALQSETQRATQFKQSGFPRRSAEKKEQYDQMKADMDKMMASAEDEAEKGNIDGSKFKVMLADEIKEKIQELEEPLP